MVSQPTIPKRLLCTMAACLAASVAAGQQPSLIEQAPFDTIVLKAGNQQLRVAPLDFPNRIVPSPFPGGALTVQWLDRPGQPIEIAWNSIQKIIMFEDLLLEQAEEMISAEKYDEAFDYLARLYLRYPNASGLDALAQRFLQRDALAAFKAGEHDRALAVLMSLHDQNPAFQGLASAVDVVGDKLIQDKLRDKKFGAARRVLDVLDKQFGDIQPSVIAAWRGRFERAAEAKVKEGASLLAAEKFQEARAAAGQALAIWPDSKPARALLDEVQRRHPTIVVGVLDRPALDASPRLDLPATTRAGRLAVSTLTQLSDYSPEGGIYRFPHGKLAQNETGRRLTFEVSPAELESGYRLDGLARSILESAEPGADAFRSGVARLLSGVAAPESDLVEVSLSQLHVRPEAVLSDVPLESHDSHWVDADPTRWSMDRTSGAGVGGTIEELLYDNEQAAASALKSGEIDVLANIMPWQLGQFRATREFSVGSYRLPKIHALIPSTSSPLMDQREFRRAIAYGIDRQRILGTVLLAGRERDEPAFQVISGPFPNGLSISDGVGYAYNDRVRPREYQPRLAALLARLAWVNLQKARLVEAGREPDEADTNTPIPTLRLAHRDDPLATVACQTIQIQLAAIGIETELVKVTESELLDGSAQYDLRYAELAMWEPLTDARRLLGPDGIAGRCSDPMLLELEKLDSARNWNEASAALQSVHQLAFGDLPVIPLWQVMDYYAFRRDIRGLGERTISLYDSAPTWRKTARGTP
ncbi:Bacterial extracellular solute-binding protein, family 5 Middle [Pirellulimonas nuda]|uniref:Bacterial extracellular solute-binding protein, family 5 Middle n=1 Tax=Pirellulimonas nuda TaxID=2528009 RepID=A0A518DB60_9BACT|nr:ABC transporter substrate-binding protein [Pirellulimonas nuda]QDU88721.1 Bacterial extracellular solute-binding protein, family 5 Middle [Pirellulimonas nuda]